MIRVILSCGQALSELAMWLLPIFLSSCQLLPEKQRSRAALNSWSARGQGLTQNHLTEACDAAGLQQSTKTPQS